LPGAQDNLANLPPEWELAGTFVPPGRVVFLEDFRQPLPKSSFNQGSPQAVPQGKVLQCKKEVCVCCVHAGRQKAMDAR